MAVPRPLFESYAQNGEDVILWRALRSVSHGHYVDVGANEPAHDSVTRAFYEHGWRGVTIEPLPEYVEMHRRERPRDCMIDAVAGARSGETLVLHEVPETGLSTLLDEVGRQHEDAGLDVRDRTVVSRTLDEMLDGVSWLAGTVHFMSIDVEGAEADVLRGLDLSRWRPWVLVVESTAPRSTEQTHHEWEPAVLAAGYEYCLFDGLSRYYVAAEHADRLRAALAYPACILDDYSTWHQRESAQRAAAREAVLEQSRVSAVRWRAVALRGWAEAARPEDEELRREVAVLRAENAAFRGTVSWRLTAPLRIVRERWLPTR